MKKRIFAVCMLAVLFATACGKEVEEKDSETTISVEQPGNDGKPSKESEEPKESTESSLTEEDSAPVGGIILPSVDFDGKSVEWRKEGTTTCTMSLSLTITDLFGMPDEEEMQFINEDELYTPLLVGEMELTLSYDENNARVSARIYQDATGFAAMFGDDEDAIEEENIRYFLTRYSDGSTGIWKYDDEDGCFVFEKEEGDIPFGWFDFSLFEGVVSYDKSNYTGMISHENFAVLSEQLYGDLSSGDFSMEEDGYYNVSFHIEDNMVSSLYIDLGYGYLSLNIGDLAEDLTVPMEIFAR